MAIFQLAFHEYQNLITRLQLDQLSVKSLGLNILPLADPVNITLLYDEYIQRDARLEKYLSCIKNCKSIIIAEASRTGNSNYIYKGEGENFYFVGRDHNYFKNVSEAEWYNSVIIDFFSPIGINHTSQPNGSRDYLNRQYLNDVNIYDAYLDQYINSILTTIQIVDIKNINIVIAAPIKTRNSILKYLNKCGLNKQIKCYKINEIGATKEFEMLCSV